jgi:hypothetical protein
MLSHRWEGIRSTIKQRRESNTYVHVYSPKCRNMSEHKYSKYVENFETFKYLWRTETNRYHSHLDIQIRGMNAYIQSRIISSHLVFSNASTIIRILRTLQTNNCVWHVAFMYLTLRELFVMYFNWETIIWRPLNKPDLVFRQKIH